MSPTRLNGVGAMGGSGPKARMHARAGRSRSTPILPRNWVRIACSRLRSGSLPARLGMTMAWWRRPRQAHRFHRATSTRRLSGSSPSLACHGSRSTDDATLLRRTWCARHRPRRATRCGRPARAQPRHVDEDLCARPAGVGQNRHREDWQTSGRKTGTDDLTRDVFGRSLPPSGRCRGVQRPSVQTEAIRGRSKRGDGCPSYCEPTQEAGPLAAAGSQRTDLLLSPVTHLASQSE